jgi:hypothetical protein
MTINFDSDREAFLAALSVVIGADSVGSLQERDFLFQRVKALPLFSAVAPGEFNKLLGSVTGKVYEGLPRRDGMLTAAAVEELLGAVVQSLNPALRKQLVEIASELSASDGESDAESTLLSQIKQKLG